jgi:hypothetical protein
VTDNIIEGPRNISKISLAVSLHNTNFIFLSLMYVRHVPLRAGKKAGSVDLWAWTKLILRHVIEPEMNIFEGSLKTCCHLTRWYQENILPVPAVSGEHE